MLEIRILPSLLSADFAHLGDELTRCKEAGAKIVHVDVMDGHFVPNLTLGPLLVEAMRRETDLFLDVHLMMTDPLDYVDAFRGAGSDAITIHVEAVGPRNMHDAIQKVRDTGAKVGLAFNPDTDPELWFPFMESVDLVMFMTVYPGFGGQSFIPQVRAFIQKTRAAFPDLDIQVDGGLNRETIPLVVADGANLLVTGNAFFKDPDQAHFLQWAEALPLGG
ncbi:MAG: ribulose-phosphate 3-epimerase [Planctomycetes bacterium]|nr:ribulose-phosphate 3-epimerase [Planctomycetota bacterium]